MERVTHDMKPRWLRDLRRFLPLKSQFVLTGNVRDLQTHETGGFVTATTLETVLAHELVDAGFSDIVYFDPMAGFRVLDRPNGQSPDRVHILSRLGLTTSNGAAPAGVDLFAATLERFAAWDAAPLALVADFASRLTIRSDALSPAEHQLFTRALVISQSMRARPVGDRKSVV